MVRAVDAIRVRYGVTDYRWFDLRDSSTADPSIESQYGITRDDYSPKPAFAVYRDLIAALRRRRRERRRRYASRSPRRPTAGPRRSRSRVPRLKRTRLQSLTVHVGTTVVKRVNRSRMPRTVKLSLRSGRAAVKLKLTATSRGKRVTRVQRRSYQVC